MIRKDIHRISAAKYAKWAKLTQPNNENIILAATVTKKSANALVGFQTRELVLTSAPSLIYGILGDETKQKGVIPLTPCAPRLVTTPFLSRSRNLNQGLMILEQSKLIQITFLLNSGSIRENSSKPQANIS